MIRSRSALRAPSHIVRRHAEIAVEFEGGRPRLHRQAPVLPLSLLSFVLVVSIATAAGSQPVRSVFVTSGTGSADLSSWPQAGGLSGLAAGDAICRAHASGAGLPGATEYVAWLSDSGTDAYCRAHGRGGTVTSNCGLAELPVDAGPWLRLDGFPMGGPLPQLLRGSLAQLAPIRFDETMTPTVSSFWTGTGEEGTSALSCSDWTSGDDGLGVIGSPTRTAHGWTESAASVCGSDRALLCLQPGAGAAIDGYQRSGALVFATPDFGPADLSLWSGANGAVGVAAGDNVCRARAQAAGFEEPQTFRAWLSDGTSNVIDRIAANGPWVRPDGVPVADDLADLVDGSLFAPANVTSSGSYLSNFPVWTGTTAQGTAAGEDCDSWSSTSANDHATAGFALESGSGWTDAGSSFTCERSWPLLCIQDLQPTVGGCVADNDTLCLGAGGRFTIEMTWQTATDGGTAAAVDIGRRDSGLFTFFDPNNLELLVKVLEGCSLNDHYWVFYGATTDVGFEMTVTDTVSGTVREYSNPLGTSAEPIKDLMAFPCSN